MSAVRIACWKSLPLSTAIEDLYEINEICVLDHEYGPNHVPGQSFFLYIFWSIVLSTAIQYV